MPYIQYIGKKFNKSSLDIIEKANIIRKITSRRANATALDSSCVFGLGIILSGI